MSRRGFQNATYLPVKRAIRAIDAICAKHPRKGWDDQQVRRDIHRAAMGDMIEMGMAKRILHASLPRNTLPIDSRAGIEHLKEMWGRIKVRSEQGIVDERLRRRRRIVEAAGRLNEQGLAMLDRTLSELDWTSGEDMSDIAALSASVNDSLRRLAGEIERSDPTDADNSAAWRMIGETGKAIHDLERVAGRRADAQCRHDVTLPMPMVKGRSTSLYRCQECNRDLDGATGRVVTYRDGRYVYASDGGTVP